MHEASQISEFKRGASSRAPLTLVAGSSVKLTKVSSTMTIAWRRVARFRVLELVLMIGCADIARGTPFPLVENGRPACSIVTATDPTPAARLAALEIQHHVMAMTGAELPIHAATGDVSGPCILVGESKATRELGFDPGDFKPGEYLVAIRPRAIVLMGRNWRPADAVKELKGRPMDGGDTLEQTRPRIHYWKEVGRPERDQGEIELPGIYDDQGTCMAAYDFLERYLGVRWYGPADINIVIPQHATISVEGPDIRRSPGLKLRLGLPGGNWPFMRGQWGEVSRDQIQLYWRRLRLGGERWACNHTFHRQTIASAFRDPEYQCKNPRGRGSQLCYTNRKLIEQVAQLARDYFDGKGSLPEGWKALGDYFALAPDDSSNFCLCPRCQDLLNQGRSFKTANFNSGDASIYWFTFVNEVAREVRKTHPDKYIATLGYWQYAIAPPFALEPNVSIAPCLGVCAFPVNPVARESDLALYRQWLAKTKAPMFMWVYYHHPMEPALIDGWKCFPHVMVHQTADLMRRFIDDGVHGIYVCGEQDQLAHYVMTKVWDNPSADVDRILEEFFRLYFGPAGPAMGTFYSRLEQIACDPANYPPELRKADSTKWRAAAWKNLGTAEQMKELGGLIASAESLATDSRQKQRVALWKRALWDWMREGRDHYLKSQVDAKK